MVYKYEFYVCHSDNTWSDMHFVEVSIEDAHQWDGDLDAMALDIFMSENSKMDIVHVGISHIEEIEDFSDNE